MLTQLLSTGFGVDFIEPKELFIIRPAPRLVLPGVVHGSADPNLPADLDCSSPAHWDGDTMYMFFSTGHPFRSSGSDLFRLSLPSKRVSFDNEAGWTMGGRWIESTYKADDGRLYMWYHNEPHLSPDRTAPRIGQMVSSDNGLTWRDLGIILEAPPGSNNLESVNKYFVGGNGDFAVVADSQKKYFYFFISTYHKDIAQQGVSIARMAYQDLARPAGKVFKWYNGRWDEPGIGGSVTPIFPVNVDWHLEGVNAFWGPSIHWNTYLNMWVMFLNRAKDKNWAQEGIYISFNQDLSAPSRWTKPVKLLDAGELEKSKWYPQVVGTNAAKRETDKLAGRTARLFVAGLSKWEIVFRKPGENSNKAENSSLPAGAEKVSLVVHAGEKSGFTVPRYITGKFCEHLYFNITNGMDAQILRNPTFSDYPFRTGQESVDGVATFHFDREEIGRRIRDGAGRWGWPEPEIEALVKSRNEALACWWTKLGPVDAGPDTGPYGGRAQRVHTRAAGQGIAQWTWLPLHRIRKFNFEMWIRSPDLKSLTAAVFGPEGKEICARKKVSPISSKWEKFEGTLEIPSTFPADKAYKFALLADEAGQFVIDRSLLYPADHINRADPEVISFLKQSNLPLLRWPGGNFASTYHWTDGIGPIEKRPTLPNYAWGEQENNFFGTDEFIEFCRAVGCEPMICINAGSGTPEEAARWLQYCNGGPQTPMGKIRASNGHSRPFNVKHWEIGNELWGRWQYHWTTAEGYVDRYRQFVKAMLKADPDIKIYACGAPVMWGKQWNDTLIAGAADILGITTDHPLIGGSVGADTDPLDVFRDFMAVPEVLEQKWAALQEDMKKAKIKNPRLAVTELQMFARVGQPASPDAEKRLTHSNLVNPSTQAEALYDVLIYHTAIRLAPFVEMVTHSATVNHGGGLRKSRERVYANPCHYAQAMFAAFAGAVPVRTELSCSTQKAPMVLPDLKNVTSEWSYKSVDALSAIASDGSLLISIVHKGTDNPVDLDVILKGFESAKKVEIQTLSADVPWAANTLENPQAITPNNTVQRIENGKLSITIKPYSVLLMKIPIF